MINFTFRHKSKIMIIVILLLFSKLNAQYQLVESFNAFYTQVILCTDSKKDYILINNGYSTYPEYLIIFSDNKYSVRQVYGEIILKYYHIKNQKKEVRQKNDVFYFINIDNSEEEILFLRSLTDEFILMEYQMFYMDNNSGKNEKVEFYDLADAIYKEDEIGSSAGILMGINASDFLKMIKAYGNSVDDTF